MWEYLFKVYSLSSTTELQDTKDMRNIMENEIDKIGEDGWEMVNFIQNKNVGLEFIYWFKRWKASDD